MDVDWVAVYGAALSTALAVSGLVRWILLRPKEREDKVRVMLETVYGPIQTADEYFGTEALARLAISIARNRDKIIGFGATLRKLVPKINSHLMELIDIIDNARPGAEAVFLEENDATKPLIAELRQEIHKWLSDHA